MTEAEFVSVVESALRQLRALSSEQFYDEPSGRYHPIMDDIGRSLRTFHVDGFVDFLRQYPQVSGWLPGRPDDLALMATTEIYFRLIQNIADERWVDGAMAKPFENGVLICALEKLQVGARELGLG
jgi:hypothetical protein